MTRLDCYGDVIDKAGDRRSGVRKQAYASMYSAKPASPASSISIRDRACSQAERLQEISANPATQRM